MKHIWETLAEAKAGAEFDVRSRGKRQRNIEVHISEPQLVALLVDFAEQVAAVVKAERAEPPAAVRSWQSGSSPAPEGYGVKCSGCPRCAAEGHYPMRPRPLTEQQARAAGETP